jgi:transposase, IS5 family
MKPRERRETGAQDMFRSRLDQIINLKHALVTLSKTVSWSFIETKCGEVTPMAPACHPCPHG